MSAPKSKIDEIVDDLIACGGSVFSADFTLGTYRYVRCESPGASVRGGHRELEMPEGMGKAHLDYYATSPRDAFARLYHVRTGHFAWYRITPAEPIAAKSAVDHPSCVPTGEL